MTANTSVDTGMKKVPMLRGVPRSWGHLSMTGCQPGVASELMKWVAVVVRIQALLAHNPGELSWSLAEPASECPGRN